MNVVAQNDTEVSPEVAARLQERAAIMKSMLSNKTSVSGYARRITFSPEFMKSVHVLRKRYFRGRFIHRHKRSVRVRHALTDQDCS